MLGDFNKKPKPTPEVAKEWQNRFNLKWQNITPRKESDSNEMPEFVEELKHSAKGYIMRRNKKNILQEIKNGGIEKLRQEINLLCDSDFNISIIKEKNEVKKYIILQKIIELIKLCPKDYRRSLLKDKISYSIKEYKDKKLPWDKIIELVKLYPEEGSYRSYSFENAIELIGWGVPLDKVIELAKLYSEKDRYTLRNDISYFLFDHIGNTKDIHPNKIPWDKIIELLKLYPRTNNPLTHTTYTMAIFTKDDEFPWDRIIELLKLCPKGDRFDFLRAGIRPLIKEDINIKPYLEKIPLDKMTKLIELLPKERRSESLMGVIKMLIIAEEFPWDKIIELVELFPKKDRCSSLEGWIRSLIKNFKDKKLPWDKIIELVELCPNKDRKDSLYQIYNLIEYHRGENIPIDITLKLTKLCPGENRVWFLHTIYLIEAYRFDLEEEGMEVINELKRMENKKDRDHYLIGLEHQKYNPPRPSSLIAGE